MWRNLGHSPPGCGIDQDGWSKMRSIGIWLEWLVVSCFDPDLYLNREVWINPRTGTVGTSTFDFPPTSAVLKEACRFILKHTFGTGLPRYPELLDDPDLTVHTFTIHLRNLHEILIVLDEGNREFGVLLPEVLAEQERVLNSRGKLGNALVSPGCQ